MPGHERLTMREHQVLKLLSQGDALKEVAWGLGISESSVNVHVGHLYDKLQVNNKVSAVMLGLHLGLIPLPTLQEIRR